MTSFSTTGKGPIRRCFIFFTGARGDDRGLRRGQYHCLRCARPGNHTAASRHADRASAFRSASRDGWRSGLGRRQRFRSWCTRPRRNNRQCSTGPASFRPSRCPRDPWHPLGRRRSARASPTRCPRARLESTPPSASASRRATGQTYDVPDELPRLFARYLCGRVERVGDQSPDRADVKRVLEDAGVQVDLLPSRPRPLSGPGVYLNHADGDTSGSMHGYKIARPGFSSFRIR